MKITKNDFKKIIFPSIIVIIVFCIIFVLIMKNQFNKYNQIYNSNIEMMVEKIKENYPNTDEKEIIKILQSEENILNGQNILAKYGYSEDMAYLDSLKKEMNLNICKNIFKFISFLRLSR